MNMQHWDKTVTVYHRSEFKDENGRRKVRWNRRTYSGCFLALNKNKALSGDDTKSSNTYVLRIPAISAEISVGDIVLDGYVPEAVGTDADVLLDRYKGFEAKSVSFNGHIPALAHVCVRGD